MYWEMQLHTNYQTGVSSLVIATSQRQQFNSEFLTREQATGNQVMTIHRY